MRQNRVQVWINSHIQSRVIEYFLTELDAGAQAPVAVDDATGAARRRSGDRPKRPSGVSARKTRVLQRLQNRHRRGAGEVQQLPPPPQRSGVGWGSRDTRLVTTQAPRRRVRTTWGLGLGQLGYASCSCFSKRNHDRGESLGIPGYPSVARVDGVVRDVAAFRVRRPPR